VRQQQSGRHQGVASGFRFAQWIVALTALVLVGFVLYALARNLTGPTGSVVLAAIVGLLSVLVTKALEFQKQREAAIAEKKRDVYRRLLAPWIRLLVEIKAGRVGDDLLSKIDLAELYGSSFDAALYGSDAVVKRYVEFRSPEAVRDPIDMLRALAALIIAMREDVTGSRTMLSEESVLRTFVNLKPDELAVLRLREYVTKNPEAQRRLAEILSSGAPGSEKPQPESAKGKANQS